MREVGKELRVPFDKGFYGGFYDTPETMLASNLIPFGYFYGTDVVNDQCGFLRARPSLGFYVTSAVAAASPIACFKLAGTYYTVPNGVAIQRCTSTTTPTWAAVTSSPIYTSKVNVDFVSQPASTTPLALVSTSATAQYLATITGGVATVFSAGNAKGIAAQDEGRVFCINNNMLYYSTRYDYTTGYDYNETDATNGGFVAIPEVCDDIVALKNVAGSLYLIQSSANTGRTYIWKKVQTSFDSRDELDLTYFTQTLGTDDACIRNGMDGIGVLGGSILFWAYGSGLNIVTDGGVKVVSMPIQSYNPAGLNYDCVVATDQRSKLIFCKETGSTVTHVYNMVNETWSRWNINVTCKGYGQSGGMFGIASNYAPAYVGAYPTTSADTSIVPVMYTPVLDLDAASREKFLTEIHCSARGVTEILVYTRLTPDDNFALLHTLTNPEQVTKLNGDSRFGECYLKISGSPLFLMKELKLVFDLGDPILEVT